LVAGAQPPSTPSVRHTVDTTAALTESGASTIHRERPGIGKGDGTEEWME